MVLTNIALATVSISLETYKTCLETADRLSERRAKANSVFSL